jgi:hypothetical protein
MKTTIHHPLIRLRYGLPKALFVLFCMFCFSNKAFSQYCTPNNMLTYGVCAGGAIHNVQFNTINHSAGCLSTSTVSDYYKDLTTTVPATLVQLGESYELKVNRGHASWAGGAQVWIDFDRDEVFEPSEVVLTTAANLTIGVVTATVVIPVTAVPGPTRMRVIASESQTPTDPCAPGSYTEVEDYAIIIGQKAYNNAGISNYTPIAPFCVTGTVNQDVKVRVNNNGANQITGLAVNWEVDGMLQTPYGYTGLLDTLGGSNPSDSLLTIGSIAFTNASPKNVKVWTSLPNNLNDTSNSDDTIRFVIRPKLDGTYTIGTGGDYASLSEAVAFMQNGICGPVTFNFIGNKVYNEQVNITAIPNASVVNTVTINGNGNTLEYATSSAARYIIRLQGAKHIIIDSLTLRSTNTTYGWGVHFYQDADSNIVRNSTIDMSLVTSTTANNSGGIVFSNSTSTINSSGSNGRGNLISNNIIKGGASGGLYYGIVIVPASNSSTPTYNQIINNTINNFYAYGIYGNNSNGTIIRGNIIRNTNKSSTNSTVYGIAMGNSSRNDVITGNQISNPFGSSTTSTNTFYGIQLISTAANTPVGSENLVSNNIIFDVKGEGTQYGITCEPAPNTYIYHNTISLNHNSTGASTITRAFYMTSGAGIQFKNNLINVTRGGTGAKHIIYLSGTTVPQSNNNVFYISTAASNHLAYLSNNVTSIADWRTASSQDNNSVFENPILVNAQVGNVEPQSTAVNNIGTNSLSVSVTVDVRNNPRSGTTPDAGAIEFTPSGCISPDSLGVNTILSNGATIGWKVPSNVPANGYEYVVSTSSSMPTVSGTPSATNTAIVSGLNPVTTYYLFVRSVCSVNGAWAGPISFTTLCAPLAGGTYHLGGTSPDFNSFTDFLNRITCPSGISGPVVLEVEPNSGPYTETLHIPFITGSSSTNTITIKGNGNTLQFSNTSSVRAIVALNGAQYITIDSLKIKSMASLYGWGVHFTASAAYNTIKKCEIDISSVTSTSSDNAVGIVFSNSTSFATANASIGNNALFNLIDSNIITGNATGNGMNIAMALNVYSNTNTTVTGNVISNNIIKNFYGTGIFVRNSNGIVIKNNKITNNNKTSFASSIYGISFNNRFRNDSILNNEISYLGGNSGGSADLYAIYFTNNSSSADLTPVNQDLYIINNRVYNLKGNENHYGIYMRNTTNAHIYHNTIVIDDLLSSGAISTALYHEGNLAGNGLSIKNNLFYVDRLGTGVKRIFNIVGGGALFKVNNNGYYVGGQNAQIGSYASRVHTTINTWKTDAASDLLSRVAFPDFVNQSNGDLRPNNGLLKQIGADLRNVVPFDANGMAHDSIADVGAYVFTPTRMNDGGVYEIIIPSALPVGNYTPSVKIFNAGADPLTTAMINWEVNGVIQQNITYTGNSIATGNFSDNIQLLSYNFLSGVAYTIKAWTSNVNGYVTDENPDNDTASLVNLYTALPGGLYTINSDSAASATNYVSYASFIQDLETFGVSGAIEVDVQDSLITTPVVFNKYIQGTSATNTITFKGKDTANTILQVNGTAAISLKGVKHIIFRDMALINNATSSASVVWLTNAADSNSIINCLIRMPLSTSSSSLYGVLASANATYEALGLNASGTLVDSCVIVGGYSGVSYIGVYPASTEPGTVDVNKHNKVRNTTILQPYTYGIFTRHQSAFEANKNIISNVGNFIYTYSYGIYLRENVIQGSIINANTITGQLGGVGIGTLWDESHGSIVSNNMIQIGTGANSVMGLDWYAPSSDIVYNSINVTSTEMNATGFRLIPTAGNSYNVLNNIIKNANPGQVINMNTGSASIKLDNNCYYGTGQFPYRINNQNAATLADFIALTNLSNDSFTRTIDPVFTSATDLRTYNPLLNNKGRAVANVLFDIDGNPRDPNTPDMGANEFTLLPKEDAGVIALVEPVLPITPGAVTDVGVVIKNLGVGALTSVGVTVNGAGQYLSNYFNVNLNEGETDTLYFRQANGSGLMIPATGGFTIEAFTFNPNNLPDVDVSNDTLIVDFCEPMAGTYTINANGTGTRNFTSFTDAINGLKCGGVSDSVTFEIASGVYQEQVVIPFIPGVNANNKIRFVSATGVKSDVVLADSSYNNDNNYIIKFEGAQYVDVASITLENKGETHSRVVVYKTTALHKTQHIGVLYCDILNKPASTNDIARALIHAEPELNENLIIKGNTLHNGSAGIFINGWQIKNQYTAGGVIIDGNTLTNQAHNAIIVSFRDGFTITNNTITSNSTAMVNAINVYEACGNASISSNTINTMQGAGVRINRYAFYNEPGELYITSNAIQLQATTAVSQLGIGLIATSKVYVHNNSVKTNSSLTSVYSFYTANYAFYVQGEITYSNLQNTPTNNIRALNNIFVTEYGYPIYVDDVSFGNGTNPLSRLAILQNNNNVYYTEHGTNVGFVITTDYPKTNFNAFKGAINLNTDSISRYFKVPFVSNTLKPLESDTMAWWINGRALHTTLVSKDVTGADRATTPYYGVPDVGAYEITPTVLPPLATAVPANPVAGQTQSFIFMGDTVARITYNSFVTAPASVQVRQFVGERPPLVSVNQKYMYNYVTVDMPQGFYDYNLQLKYRDEWTGTMYNNETSLKMITRDEHNFWSLQTTSTTDSVYNYITSSNVNGHTYIFTGTDLNDPLPVKLISFTANKLSERAAKLSWKVAEEKNFKAYQIERSFDGNVFEKVGEVKGAHLNTYNYNDQLPVEVPVAYYRLKMLDNDGSFEYSNVAVVRFTANSAIDVTAAPNPVLNKLSVSVSGVTEVNSLQLFDINGSIIKDLTSAYQESNVFDVSDLKAGVYFLKVQTNNETKVIKLIKQ